MSLEEIRASLPEYARDLRLNLGSVLSQAGAPGLSETQIWVIALAAALAARNARFARALEALAAAQLQPAQLQAAHAAAAIMGMNNVYYRFLHLVGDSEYQRMPARLRMNVIANPGIDKVDFCSPRSLLRDQCLRCASARTAVLRQHGVTRADPQHRAHRRDAHAVAGSSSTSRLEAGRGARFAPRPRLSYDGR
jgi:alkyl hydroperoxide reductase subunit D